MLLPYHTPNVVEAGCDEAGRGCLAGPVFAAAVVLPEDFSCEELNDSKKLTEKMRYQLRPLIEEQALDWAVGVVSAQEIDEINILRASIEGMNVAAANLKVAPQFLAIDGNRFISHNGLPYKCIVKGDGKYANIAAASVLAKTHRDEYMLRLHEEYPNYGWDRNKGYPTKEHRMAIREYGLTPYHRLSFNHTEGQLELF